MGSLVRTVRTARRAFRVGSLRIDSSMRASRKGVAMKRALLPLLAATLIAVLIGVAIALAPTRPAPRISIFRTTQPTTRYLSPNEHRAIAAEIISNVGSDQTLGAVFVPPDRALIVTQPPESRKNGSAGTLKAVSISNFVRTDWVYTGTVTASAPPVHTRGLLIFSTTANAVVAFDDRAYEQVWSWKPPTPMIEIVRVTDEIVIGAGDETLVAFDPETARPKWTQHVGRVQRDSLAVFAEQGRRQVAAYVDSTGHGQFELVVVDSSSGTIDYQLPIPGVPLRRAVHDGADIFVLTRSGDPEDEGTLRTFAASDRRPKWQFRFPRPKNYLGTGSKPAPREPVADEQRVYVTVRGSLMALERTTGKEAWTWTTAEAWWPPGVPMRLHP